MSFPIEYQAVRERIRRNRAYRDQRRRETWPFSLNRFVRASELLRGAATEYVGERIPDLASFVVGLTERDVEVSQAKALAKIARSIVNEGAPYSALIFGGMNRGRPDSLGCGSNSGASSSR